METNKILAWIATVISVPAVFWLFTSVSSNKSIGATNSESIRMMNQHIIEARAEDRAWRESLTNEISGIREDFSGIARGFYEMKGVFDTIDFKPAK
jgi:hypothetical protein